MSIPVILVGLVLFVFSVFIRSIARLIHRDFGIDTWYYLLYAESFRRNKRLPVNIPFYLLDEDLQFYPPGFPILLSMFSAGALQKFHWLINPLIDSLHLLLLYIVTFAVSSNIIISVFATLLYLSSPILITQSSNLNSRMFGSLVLTLLILSVNRFVQSHDLLSFFLSLLFGIILSFSHKMSMQQFLIFILGLTFIYNNQFYLTMFISIFFASLLLGRKLYLGILNSHVRIIRFWSKNIPFIGGHQIYDSNLYKRRKKAMEMSCVKGLRSSKFYSALERIRIGGILLAATGLFLFGGGVNKANPYGVFYWVLLNYFTVFATSYLPFFKNFGEGYKYLSYGVFPSSLFISLYSFTALAFPYSFVLVAIILAMNIAVSSYIIHVQSHNFLAQTDEPLLTIFSVLKGLPRDNVMCLPFSKADALAYFTRKKVLFGGHSLGWEKLDDFWPVLKKPLEYFIEKYTISYILIDGRFVDISDLNLKAGCSVLQKVGNYTLLEL